MGAHLNPLPENKNRISTDNIIIIFSFVYKTQKLAETFYLQTENFVSLDGIQYSQTLKTQIDIFGQASGQTFY